MLALGGVPGVWRRWGYQGRVQIHHMHMHCFFKELNANMIGMGPYITGAQRVTISNIMNEIGLAL